jgi:hypothetical protein
MNFELKFVTNNVQFKTHNLFRALQGKENRKKVLQHWRGSFYV